MYIFDLQYKILIFRLNIQVMYNKIYEFCKVRNIGNIYKNDPKNGTPRVNFIIDLLKSENIEHYLDIFPINETSGYNIILKGTSNRIVVAHHEINNPNIDNANDNSASVINAIMIKMYQTGRFAAFPPKFKTT